MFTPRIALLCLLLAAPVAVVATAPEWASAVGLDVWNLPSIQTEIDDQVERERDLKDQDEAIRRRIEVKETIVAELIAGQATLAEVTAQFLALNQAQPNYLAALRATYPSPTDEETVARTVLGFVGARLSALTPEERAEVTARLEVEFSRLVEAHPATE